jgi:1-acyl-sn-glycerol-3-phosphate acyltransferase
VSEAYRFLKRTVPHILPLLIELELVGGENFPERPPYILATNHLSVFDLPVIFVVCPHQVHAFAAAKHRRNLFYAPILSAVGAIWVQRGEVDRRALREALQLLENGHVLGMAPEGTRSRDSYSLLEGKAGPAYLATRADVPLLPVGLAGTENVKENLPRLRRTQVRMAVGEPFRLPTSGRVRTPKLREYTDLIMHRIAELVPPEYRGIYG